MQACLKMTDVNPLNFSTVLQNATVPYEVAKHFEHIQLPFELMPHQLKNLQCGLAWDRYGLFDPPRTGKTIVMQLLAIYHRLFGMKTIVLMPPILFEQFREEFHKIKGHGLRVEMLTGSADKKRNMIQDWGVGNLEAPDVLLMTKEMFSGPNGNKGFLKYMDYLKKPYQILMWDECHLGLQSEDTKIFSTVERFLKEAKKPRLILSTGTPSTNELRATYPTIRLKTPDEYVSRRHFDMTHVNFKELYISSPRSPSGVRRISVVDSYCNQELLSQALMKQASRVTRHEVLNIQTPNVQVVPIALDPPHLYFYRKILRERLAEIGTDMIDLRQEQALRQFALRIITDPNFGGGNFKTNNVVQAVKTLIEAENLDQAKVIVFANFNHSVEFLSEQLEAHKPAVVYGQNTPEKNRQEAERFKKSSDCRVAVINPQAGGVGYTFGDVCQTVIFAEPVATPGLFDQAASRIILKDQKEPVSIYLLKILETISPKAIDNMLNKSVQLQEVLRDKKTLLDDLIPSA
jgi:hypothetical protein